MRTRRAACGVWAASLVVIEAARYGFGMGDFGALYREHAPAVTAALARSFGAHRLDLVEAAGQEAFVSALKRCSLCIHKAAKSSTTAAVSQNTIVSNSESNIKSFACVT